MNKLAIVGAGGHGKVVADAAITSSLYAHIVFVDDRYQEMVTQLGYGVVGDDSCIPDLISQGYEFVVAIGDNLIRASKFALLKSEGANFATVIHKSAVISSSAEIGKGTVVFAGVCINPDAKVGNNSIINTNATIEHDCVVGDHVHLAPGTILTGGCQIGDYSLLGAGAVSIPYKTIGSRTVVGAGAVIVEDIPDSVIASGIPAKW
ncbi:acetyltransferase [Paraneptunicella aestuarii]|uniref:acetyltransferase n=1 Tax=Paraneptunicella aestuarii TaxID=2831148 RepID=UPI001E62A901|nr:acetyltransferase [Paraneptunicella aestuarii]UAA39665.1 acetyltransferase [Paraneptunicella aestuarii]